MSVNHQINQPTNNFNKITHLIPHYDNSISNQALLLTIDGKILSNILNSNLTQKTVK